MIQCPVCQAREPEGEVFCSECGARLVTLWPEITSTEAFIDTALVRETARLRASAPVKLHAGQVSLSFAGQSEPVLLEGRSEYVLGRDGSGDVPYELRSLSGTLVATHPQLDYFRGSPALFLIDAASHVLPLFRPKAVLVDARPWMGRGRPGGTDAP